ncbi:MAG TPA: sigma-54 dependent transcriptional regulator [Terriglobia bacterium]|nr:sigma-54 dependent transcriptional regulator [Terriglobia bacterium]
MITCVLESTRESLHSIIVASSDTSFRERVVKQLAASDHLALEAGGGAEALAMIEDGPCRTLLLDRILPDLNAGELIEIIRARHPQVEVILIDSQRGSADGVDEPSSNLPGGILFRLLQNSREPRIPVDLPLPPARCVAPSLSSDDETAGLPGMKGRSPSLRRVYRLARLVAPRQTTVLLTGETGTGKELVAHALHLLSPRQERPYVIINCAAIPEPLLEAELFGYNRGAFTGAVQSRLGRLQLAQGGTVFLDEIGDLPLSMQAKLLRFLQEGEVQRLGCSEPVRVDARIIAATNSCLPRLVKEGRFRDDLYYRLAVFPIDIAPLRSRREDIQPLSEHFLDLFSREEHAHRKTLSPQASRALDQYSWPGNVRQLRQVIERGFILAEERQEIGPEHLSWDMGEPSPEKNLIRET